MAEKHQLNSNGSIINKWKFRSIQQVEDVKCLARIFPIWAAGILSLTSMAQQGTFTISLLTIALTLPLYDKIIVPSLRKMTNHEGGITLLQRIGIGMFFSILSMIVAGFVEKIRRDSANSKPMSVFWLAHLMILMGLCEAFNILGQIEFFNRQFPDHMRSIGNTLFSCSVAIASYVSSIIVNVIHHTTRTHDHDHPDWLVNDINKGRIDYFYYLIAMIGTLNFVFFIYVARRY
jgi:peptide/histidine transporter 3/4